MKIKFGVTLLRWRIGDVPRSQGPVASKTFQEPRQVTPLCPRSPDRRVSCEAWKPPPTWVRIYLCVITNEHLTFAEQWPREKKKHWSWVRQP